MEERVSNKELLMRNKSPLIGIYLGIFTLFRTVTFAQQPADVSASLNEAEQMCASLGDANKALVRSAGYDLVRIFNLPTELLILTSGMICCNIRW
jgi:hypothetical protein